MAPNNISKHSPNSESARSTGSLLHRFVSFWNSNSLLTDRRGKTGEAAAAKYLKSKGVKILLRNVRVGPGELDLICRQEETLVIVEVKARQQDAWERPSEAVDKRKRRILNQCADAYLKELSNPDINVRFDIVEVKLDGDEVMGIQWLANAFGPKDL